MPIYKVIVRRTGYSDKEIEVDVSHPTLIAEAALEKAPTEEFPPESDVKYDIVRVLPLSSAAPSPQRPRTNTVG
jgi:hypothetical protein